MQQIKFNNVTTFRLHPVPMPSALISALFRTGRSMRPVVSRPPRAPFAEQRACMCHRSPRPEVVSRASPSDLRRLRGVGRTYEALLSAQAIASIADLQAVFHQRLGADTAQLQRFLAQVVGIRNSRHCRAVAEDISERDWEQPVLAGAEGPGGRDPGQGRITLAVEGNIGAGKSTFLNLMADGSLELQDIVEIVPEPVDEWQAVASGDNGPINLLDRFYKDPRRYAYTFQHYVLLTRMQKARLGNRVGLLLSFVVVLVEGSRCESSGMLRTNRLMHSRACPQNQWYKRDLGAFAN